ncbi:MAG: FAD-binding oxidoreductase [Rhodobacteraceae bacterium]|nr:FAD-binding oxidoreductase [Paracoccaceae bacterium]
MFYEAEAYDTTRWPASYWRATRPAPAPCAALEGAQRTDIAIIGAGYAGLNAALELVEHHGADVTVLEAAQPGWGASGRNGGFCCLGGTMLDEAAITRRHGTETARDWDGFETRAIERVRDNLSRYAIDADPVETGELLLTGSARRWAAIQATQRAPDAVLLDRAALRDQGFATACYHGGRMAAQGFGLNPYAYALGLARGAQSAGVRLHGDSAVIGLHRKGGRWQLHTQRGQLSARHVLIASNGYSSETLLPWLKGRILPVISNIMVTRPITPAELQAQGWTRQMMAHDDRRLLHYFRLLPDNRLLFGARGGLSFTARSVAAFAARARADFDCIFPHFARAKSQFTWNGLVCLTSSRAPYIGPVPGPQGLWLALGWHGNGVAAASEGGRRVARAMMGQPDAPPRLARHHPPRLAVPRKFALRAAMALAGLRDGPMRPL